MAGRDTNNFLYTEYDEAILDTRIAGTALEVDYNTATEQRVSTAFLQADYLPPAEQRVNTAFIQVEYAPRPPSFRAASARIPFQGWNFPVINRNFQGSKGRPKWGQWTPKGQVDVSETVATLGALLGFVGWTYYDAAENVSYDGNSRAVTWAPIAGDTPNAIFEQTDPAQRPFISTLNGQPALFSGVTPVGWMEIPNAVKWTLPANGRGFVYVVLEYQGTSVNTAGNGVLGDLTASAGMFMLAEVSGAIDEARTGSRLNAGTTYFADSVNPLVKNRGLVLGFERNTPTTTRTRVNELASSDVASGNFTNSTDPLKVFRYNINNSSIPFGLKVAGILSVRHGLSSAQAAQVRQALYDRWRIVP
jgi:hypothetical protein